MADSTQSGALEGRNIIILSDGTGQRGGVYFDEARTNIYKLYRATRSGPDSTVPAARQLAFYDPGLGTQPTDGALTSRLWRTIYNYVSQATGLGITRNIIDCYAAVIELWRPGDRIFLFGFSRGAYTVRCLAAALCKCGIPSRGWNGGALKRDPVSAQALATRAVKSVYQHVSSPRDAQFVGQRAALAARFRQRCASSQEESAFPYFIGVFDTVAALSNRSSLAVLAVVYAALLFLIAAAASFVGQESLGYWIGWLLFDSTCALLGAYIYTHLKFTFGLPEFHWWETFHLTTFRQQFYDQSLDERIMFARHAISIDERRADFQRVPWGFAGHWEKKDGIPRLVQLWFAGNHADIGGGYPETESHLSDISLKWMLGEASDKLGPHGLVLDRSVLHLNDACDGKQHDETRSLAFRLMGKSDRAPLPTATLHPSVGDRFQLAGVLQYDVTAPYRPEALRTHADFATAYVNVPFPHATCAQRLRAAWKGWRDKRGRLHPPGWARVFLTLKELQVDRIVSCIALACFILGGALFIGILGYQVLTWLVAGVWPPIPLETIGWWIRALGSSWLGLQRVYDVILAAPLSIAALIVGTILFSVGNRLSSYLYRRAAQAATPSQAHA